MKRICLWGFVLLMGLGLFGLGVERVSAECDPPLCYNNDECSANEGCFGGCCKPRPGGGDDDSCFPAGTKVKLEGGEEIAIEEVRTGQEVISEDERGVQIASKVKELKIKTSDNMCELSFVSGKKLRLTDNHAMLTNQGWGAIDPGKARKEIPNLAIGLLEQGDWIRTEKGSWDEVERVSCWSEESTTYNLELEGVVNTYFAGGYLAHNKANPKGSWWCPAGTHLEYSDPPEYYRNDRGRLCLYKASCQPPPGSVDSGDWPYGSGTSYEGCRVAAPAPASCKPGTAYCQACACVPDCSATAPSGLTITWADSYSGGLSWTNGTGGSNVLLRVDEDLAEVNAGCPTPGDCEVKATLPPTQTNYAFSGMQPDTTYYFRVVNYESGTCFQAAVESSRSPEIPAIEGTVYYDGGRTCAPSSSVAYTAGAGVTVEGFPAVTTDAGGNFRVETGVAGSYNVALNEGSLLPGFECLDCPSYPCPTQENVSTAGSPVAFLVTDVLLGEMWWQVVGAGAYAGATGGGNTIVSNLPRADEKLVIPGTSDLAALVRASGNVDTGLGEISEANWSARSRYEGKKMDFRFFAAQMGVTLAQEDEFGNDTISKPVYGEPALDFHYSKPVGGTTTLNDSWVVAAGESYVVFVDGDLRITSDVVVEEGGFLAFIVNGGVTVETGVEQLEGIYVMDGLFTTETGGVQADELLRTGGMVVAWEGVRLNRDLGGETNYTTPAEQFVYRPDLLVNMPEKMKNFTLRWREVEPGTIN